MDCNKNSTLIFQQMIFCFLLCTDKLRSVPKYEVSTIIVLYRAWGTTYSEKLFQQISLVQVFLIQFCGKQNESEHSV